MTVQERARDWREKYFWLIIGLIFLFGASLIVFRFRFTDPTQKPVGEMLGAFGEALMISGVLAATVDQFVKFRVIREVMSDVWQYLANHRVPIELSDYLHDALQATIVRRELVAKYKLSRSPGGKMRADIEISYKIENYGNRDEVLWIFISEQEHKHPVFEEISCLSSDPQGKIPAGNPLVITNPESGVKKAEVKGYESIVVQPYRVGLFYEVKFKYHLESIFESDSDVLSFNGPTLDVRIEAQVPSTVTFVAPKPTLADAGTWVYKRAFLKEQHLFVRWFPNLPKP
jgi:hypothetical protein